MLAPEQSYPARMAQVVKTFGDSATALPGVHQSVVGADFHGMLRASGAGESTSPFIADKEKRRLRVIAQESIGRLLGKTEDTAATALFLCSNEAGFTAGRAMLVNGGPTAGL